jgi:hypothetical protein
MAANRARPTVADLTQPRQILDPGQIDRVADALLALTRELWVTRDRQILLEGVLAKHGIDAGAEIDAIEPDAALQARLDGERDRLIGAVVAALNGGE